MGFFHCKIDPGEKNKSPKSFNIKLLKNSQVLPIGKQIQSAGKMSKNSQVLFKKNDQIIKSDPDNRWKQSIAGKKSLAAPGQSQPHPSLMEKALHHRRAGSGKSCRAKPSAFSQLHGCSTIICHRASPSPSPPQAPGSPTVKQSLCNSLASTTYCQKIKNSIYWWISLCRHGVI